jgi:hypothetical protein
VIFGLGAANTRLLALVHGLNMCAFSLQPSSDPFVICLSTWTCLLTPRLNFDVWKKIYCIHCKRFVVVF